MKPAALILFSAALLACSPALSWVGWSMGSVAGTAITEIVQADKDLREGRAIRVGLSALRQIGNETKLVTAFTSGQTNIPSNDQSVIIDLNQDGLSVNIMVMRDYRGEVMVVLDAQGSVLSNGCVLVSGEGCQKSISSYTAREQLLLSPGINKVRVGDYRITVNVEGSLGA